MWKRRWLGIVCLGLLCLVGCGRGTEPVDSQASENVGVPGTAGVLEGSEIPETSEKADVSGTSAASSAEQGWKTKGFSVLEKVEEETALWATEYDVWQHEDIRYDPSTEFVYERMAGVCGDQLYRFCQVYPKEENGNSRCLLEIYDASAGQTSLIEIDSEKSGAGGGQIVGMYMPEPGKYLFRILNEQERIHKIVYTDLGDQTRVVDVRSVYQEMGIEDKLCYECICDAAGNIYTRDGNWQNLYIFDREGSLLMEHKGKSGDSIREPFPMSAGELIFPVYNSEDKTSRLVWFDTEQKEAHTLCSFETYPIESVYGIQDSDVYYETREGIVRWNIISGERILIYSFEQKHRSGVYRTMLVLRKGLAPVLRMYGTVNDEEEDWLVTLSEEEPEAGEAIRVVSLVKTGATGFDLKSYAAAVSRKYKNAGFVYETFDNAGQMNYQTGIDNSDHEAYRIRILAELSAGGGPDILMISVQDMRLLQDQGYLMDLRNVLSEDYLNRFLPNVIDLGTVNDIFVGLAPVVKTDAAITLKEIWNQETWTLEAGGCLMQLDGLGIESINEFYDQYGDAYCVVGHPTLAGNGNYLSSGGVLAVNRRVSDQEGVAAFFEYLLVEEVQNSSWSEKSILKISTDDIEYTEEAGERKARWKGHELRIKEDGATTLDDYITFIESCVPAPQIVEADLIKSIVWEEAEAYIIGDKSAEEVAGVVQSRVQLYLDENR